MAAPIAPCQDFAHHNAHPKVVAAHTAHPHPGCGASFPAPHDRCSRNHAPPAPGAPTTRTVCRDCWNDTRRLLGSEALTAFAHDKIQFLHGGPNSMSPPFGWGGPPGPPWKGFLSPLCIDCEQNVLNEAWWRGGSNWVGFHGPTLGIQAVAGFPAIPRGPALSPIPQASRCYRYPMATCTCLHTVGAMPPSTTILPALPHLGAVGGLGGPPGAPIVFFGGPGPSPAAGALGGTPAFPIPPANPPTNDVLCLEHREQEWNALKARRDTNDQWLRNIARNNGGLGQASAAVKAQRDARGTHRACRCGRELRRNIPAPPHGQPVAYICLGCEGYVVSILGAGLATHFSTPTRAAPTPWMRPWYDRLQTRARLRLRPRNNLGRQHNGHIINAVTFPD